jgi:hypothetical protein
VDHRGVGRAAAVVPKPVPFELPQSSHGRLRVVGLVAVTSPVVGARLGVVVGSEAV